MSGLYGSLVNRMCEDKQFCDTIEVGTRMTEYSYDYSFQNRYKKWE